MIPGEIFQDLLEVRGSHRGVGAGKELAFSPGQSPFHRRVGLGHFGLAVDEALIFRQEPAFLGQFLAPGFLQAPQGADHRQVDQEQRQTAAQEPYQALLLGRQTLKNLFPGF